MTVGLERELNLLNIRSEADNVHRLQSDVCACSICISIYRLYVCVCVCICDYYVFCICRRFYAVAVCASIIRNKYIICTHDHLRMLDDSSE